MATDTISLGWGVVGRIAEGTRVTYARHQVDMACGSRRADASRPTAVPLLFRSFDVDMMTEWFDYRRYDPKVDRPGPS